jgi:FKBP-type peptidyl-prolyl cis-trans isomerase
MVMAIAFLITTVGVGIGFAYQVIKEENSPTTSPEQLVTTPDNANKLQGTKMQDFTPVASVSELQIIDLKEGAGEAVKEGDSVTVDYTGADAATGVVFESSKDSGRTVNFRLDEVIEGWTKGMPGMKVGGVRRLLIPAAQAYGNVQGHELQKSDLVFDIELHSIGK